MMNIERYGNTSVGVDARSRSTRSCAAGRVKPGT